MQILLFVLLLFMTHDASAYKFICNSIDADGNVQTDQCSANCDDRAAARWFPADIGLLIDSEVLPPGISKDVWMKAALNSLESWVKVPGANIDMRYLGQTINKNFGNDSKNHEIFWVLDSDEWRKKAGAGENDTLGVTLSPYICPNSTRQAREIYDADMMLNGTDTFKWQASCDKRDCNSIVSVLTHELGHVLGLGHPCTLCSNSIMTAQAGFHIEYPMFDDQEALRVLYPGTSSGELGSRCDQNSECKNGFNCIVQEDAHYCSQPCSSGSSCPPGFACADQMCQFAIGRLAGAVGLGESCQSKYCESGLLCAGSDKAHLYCYKECKKSVGCSGRESCLLLEGEKEKGVCTHLGQLGEVCDWKNPCGDQLICVIEGEKGFCRTICTPDKKDVCGMGETCRDLGQGKSACWSESGGPIAKPPAPSENSGSLCTSTRDSASSAWMFFVILLPALLMLFRQKKTST